MTDQPDMINHPPHYTSCPSGIECIEIAELLPFCLGNAYKYLHRAGLKGSTADMVDDLHKMLFYVRRAYLNGESLPQKARTLILEVARHKAKPKQELFLRFAKHPLKKVYLFLEHELNSSKDDICELLDNCSA